MMKTHQLILLAFLLAQCTNAGKRVPAPEDFYLEDNFTVISTYFNPGDQTTSILFGNARARESAGGGYVTHNAGEDYRLVTWNQHGNPLWFGGSINGSIKSIEQVSVAEGDNGITFTYDAIQGDTAGISGEQRIAYILSLNPLIFP
jgi:hypothetical protein